MSRAAAVRSVRSRIRDLIDFTPAIPLTQTISDLAIEMASIEASSSRSTGGTP